MLAARQAFPATPARTTAVLATAVLATAARAAAARMTAARAPVALATADLAAVRTTAARQGSFRPHPEVVSQCTDSRIATDLRDVSFPFQDLSDSRDSKTAAAGLADARANGPGGTGGNRTRRGGGGVRGEERLLAFWGKVFRRKVAQTGSAGAPGNRHRQNQSVATTGIAAAAADRNRRLAGPGCSGPDRKRPSSSASTETAPWRRLISTTAG